MYNDEKLIEAMNRWENQKKSDIMSGVYIDGDIYEFEYIKLFNDKMHIMLPKVFRNMPQKMKEIKFPSSERPPIIKTNLDGSVCFTFNILNIDCKPEQVPELIKQFKLVTTKLMPHYQLADDYVGKTKNGVYGAYDYSCSVLDGKLYNMVFCACIDNKLMHGGFNCRYSDQEWWKQSVLQVCESIIDATKAED